MNKNLKILICVLFFIFSSYAQERPVICRPNNMISALIYLAELKGFFKEFGLDPKFETATNAKLCQDTVLAGKADFSASADGPFTYLAISNPAVKILARTQINPETGVFARKDRGINNFADLKGKKIGYLPGGVSYFYFANLLKKYNWKKSDFKLFIMQPPAMAPALLGGAVDAYVVWEPWGDQSLKQLGVNGINLSDPSIYQYEAYLLASNAYLDKKPKVGELLLRTLIKSEEFIEKNPIEAKKLLSDKINFDLKVLDSLWTKYYHRVSLDLKAVDLLNNNFLLLKEYEQDYQNINLPNYKSLFDPSYLRKIDNLRVDQDF